MLAHKCVLLPYVAGGVTSVSVPVFRAQLVSGCGAGEQLIMTATAAQLPPAASSARAASGSGQTWASSPVGSYPL